MLLYLIIQNSVNLNLIAVCHGEAQWARVGEQLFTVHTAAGSLLFQVRDKVVAGDSLTWSQTPVFLLFVTGKSVDVKLVSERSVKGRKCLFCCAFGESHQISVRIDACRQLNELLKAKSLLNARVLNRLFTQMF